MNEIFQNYAILKSNLVPNNPIQTFLPFFIILLENKEINEYFTEKELSDAFNSKYGSICNYSLSHSMIEYLLANDGIKKVDKESYKVEKDVIKKYNFNRIDEFTFKKNYLDLKNGYQDFCGINNLSDELFNSMLLKFLRKYSNSIFSESTSANINFVEVNEKDEEYDFMLVEYIKYIEKIDKTKFVFIMNIAGGSLIFNYIFDNTSERIGALKGKNLILDTPVILRILGYCSEYYKNEYDVLLKKWKNLGSNIVIFDFTLEEVKRLLVSCIEWIESIYYDYTKASYLSNYFKFGGFSKQDVEEAYINLEENLKKKGIGIMETHSSTSDLFWSRQREFEEIITDFYDANGFISNNRSNDQTINYDAKSLSMISVLNEDVIVFHEAKNLFLTPNSGLIKINSNKFGTKKSSIVKDSVIGLIYSTSIEEIDELQKLKFMSYCSDLFSPNQKTKDAYITFVEQAKVKNEINEEQYFLLRNYNLIPDILMDITKGNTIELGEESIFTIYNKIESKILEENNRLNKNEIDMIHKKHNEEIKNLEKNYEEKFCGLNDKLCENKELLDSRIKKDLEIIKKKYNNFLIFLIIITSAVIIILFVWFFAVYFNLLDSFSIFWKSAIELATAIPSIYGIFSLILTGVEKKINVISFVKLLLDCRLKKLQNEYDIPLDLRFKSNGLRRIK